MENFQACLDTSGRCNCDQCRPGRESHERLKRITRKQFIDEQCENAAVCGVDLDTEELNRLADDYGFKPLQELKLRDIQRIGLWLDLAYEKNDSVSEIFIDRQGQKYRCTGMRSIQRCYSPCLDITLERDLVIDHTPDGEPVYNDFHSYRIAEVR